MKELIAQYKPYLSTFGDNPYIQSLVIILVALIAAKVIDLVIQRILKRWAEKTKNGLDNKLIEIIHKPLFYSVVLLGLVVVVVVLELPPEVGGALLAALKSILVVLWSLFALRLTRILLRRLSRSKRQARLVRTQTLTLFENLALVLIVALALYLIFSAWDIDMTAWFASAGIAGIAIGFAAKDTLANLFSGVFILADAPYKIGDFVVLDSGERGQVTHIGIRSTRLLTRDDVEVTIPNSIMGNSKITNESGGPHEKHRIRVQLSVAYGSDIDRIYALLLEIAADQDKVCEEPEPRVRFRSFGASGLEFELLCWIEEPVQRGQALDALNAAVYKRFNREGVEIPFAKQDLYIKEFPKQQPPPNL
jgi:small-conductance mechanosensitive channel